MKEFKEKTIFCECGSEHKLSNCKIAVEANVIDKMVEVIATANIHTITFFYGLDSDQILSKFKNSEKLKNIIFSFFIVPNCVATVQLAKQIEFRQQDLIVAIGNDDIISVAKYYAYCVDCPLYICPIGNFTDFTFSKFSRLYDGMTFNFYESQSPNGIFVDTKVNGYNEYQTYYLSSKFIAVFDNQINDLVYKMQDCQRMNDYLSETMHKYIKLINLHSENKNLLNIWTLIRLGQGMSFFGQTKYFFGGDKAVVELLNAIRPSADFLRLESIALKLILNTYSCFLQQPVQKGEFNINKEIKALSNFLKVSSSQIMKRLASSKLLLTNVELAQIFSGYQPYLYGKFKSLAAQMFKIQTLVALKDNVLQSYQLTGMEVELAFAMSPCLYNKPTLLHILNNFGYMDKLL